jgi:hypothetical protein
MEPKFLVKERIGPMEQGTRAGEYLEAGEVVSADAFHSELSIAILQGVGAIESADAEAVRADAVSDESSTRTSTTLSAPLNLEDEHGTDNSNGD